MSVSSYNGFKHISFQSEGNLLGKPTIVNFKGVGVTTTYSNGVATITIPGVDGAIAGPLQLGILRIGPGMSIDPNGIASAGLKRSDNNRIISDLKVGHGEYIDSSHRLVVPQIVGEASKGILVARVAEETRLSLDRATPTVLGGVKIGQGINISNDGAISVDTSNLVATVPKASDTVLGGIKVGSGLAINDEGVLSVTVNLGGGGTNINPGYGLKIGDTGDLEVKLSDLPTASAADRGFIKIGTGLSIDSEGVVSVVETKVASKTQLGIVRIGDNIDVTPQGVISVLAATPNNLGLVKPGSGLSVTSDGTLNFNSDNLPVATTSSTGVVRVGQGLKINTTGVLSLDYDLPAATVTNLGAIRVGSGLAVTPDGTLSVTVSADTLPTGSKTIKGLLQVGDNIDVTNGVISVTFPQIPTIPNYSAATATELGLVRVGSGLSITSEGILSANIGTSLADSIGTGLTLNNDTGKIDVVFPTPPARVIASKTQRREVVIGDGIEVDSEGTISVNLPDTSIFNSNRILIPKVKSFQHLPTGTPVGLDEQGRVVRISSDLDQPECLGVINTHSIPSPNTLLATPAEQSYSKDSKSVRVVRYTSGNLPAHSEVYDGTNFSAKVTTFLPEDVGNNPILYKQDVDTLLFIEEEIGTIEFDIVGDTVSVPGSDSMIVTIISVDNGDFVVNTGATTTGSITIVRDPDSLVIVKAWMGGVAESLIVHIGNQFSPSFEYDIVSMGLVDEVTSVNLPANIGKPLFLSSQVHGTYTENPESTNDWVSLPVGIKLSNTSIFVSIKRGFII